MTDEELVNGVIKYWPIFLAGVISVLNGFLSHYKDVKGVGQWLNIAIDMLSVLQRKNSPGTLKAPMVRSNDP